MAKIKTIWENIVDWLDWHAEFTEMVILVMVLLSLYGLINWSNDMKVKEGAECPVCQVSMDFTAEKRGYRNTKIFEFTCPECGFVTEK